MDDGTYRTVLCKSVGGGVIRLGMGLIYDKPN